MNTEKLPKGWGNDKLSAFFESAQKNEYASFEMHHVMYEFLSQLDAGFHDFAEKLINTNHILPALMYMRSHSAFRAATRLVMSGQIPESYVLSRSCLEYSMYSHHISKSISAEKIWCERHDSEKSKSKSRQEFIWGNVVKSLKARDSSLADKVSELYDGLIDHGAHPNEKAVTTALRVPITDKGYNLSQVYLDGDKGNILIALRNTVSVGLYAMYIFRLIWKERFDIVGLTGLLDEISRNLSRA